jgi:hypothetical protein
MLTWHIAIENLGSWLEVDDEQARSSGFKRGYFSNIPHPVFVNATLVFDSGREGRCIFHRSETVSLSRATLMIADFMSPFVPMSGPMLLFRSLVPTLSFRETAIIESAKVETDKHMATTPAKHRVWFYSASNFKGPVSCLRNCFRDQEAIMFIHLIWSNKINSVQPTRDW